MANLGAGRAMLGPAFKAPMRLCASARSIWTSTPQQIPGIAQLSDEFVQTLKRAHVNSITLFSRHHGMIYHDTKFPALRTRPATY